MKHHLAMWRCGDVANEKRDQRSAAPETRADVNTSPNHQIAKSPNRHITTSPHRAFTLVELVVVIGIIVILAAVMVGVATAIGRKSEERQTENVLKLMDLALNEWQVAADREPTWGKDGTPNSNSSFDIQSDEEPEHQATDLFNRLLASSGPKEILSKIDAKMMVRVDDNPPEPAHSHVIDAWDKHMAMVHPGPLWVQGSPLIKDKDGTIRTDPAQVTNMHVDSGEVKFGVCVNRRICFISAGPDGEFGDLHLDKAVANLTPTDHEDINKAGDNLYSYLLAQERAP